MPTAGPNPPGTLANDATVGTVDWTNPGNAAASDNSYAVAVLGAITASHYLKATNFGFSLPAGVTPTAVSVAVERNGTTGAGDPTTDNSVKLVVSGSIVGAEKGSPTSWGSPDNTATYNWNQAELVALGVTDDTLINLSTFGFVISALGDSTTASIDAIAMTVTYSRHSLLASTYSVSSRLARGGR